MKRSKKSLVAAAALLTSVMAFNAHAESNLFSTIKKEAGQEAKERSALVAYCDEFNEMAAIFKNAGVEAKLRCQIGDKALQAAIQVSTHHNLYDVKGTIEARDRYNDIAVITLFNNKVHDIKEEEDVLVALFPFDDIDALLSTRILRALPHQDVEKIKNIKSPLCRQP